MRQFVSSCMPDSDGRIALGKKEYRYLSRVLRFSDGASVDVRLSDGSLVSMRFCANKEQPCLLSVADTSASARVATTAALCTDVQDCVQAEFWLFQLLPKPQKMDLIVRQAAECGVSRIVPVVGEYSPPGFSRAERWRRIIREARQQSGSAVATFISEPLCVQNAAALWEDKKQSCRSAAFMLCEKRDGASGLLSHIGAAVKNGLFERPVCTALAVGCEGGISPIEKIVFEQSGFVPIHFKTNILRTETAALYGLAVLQSAVTEYGEWKLSE